MKKSNFASAHGMYHPNNYSSANDIAKLCYHTMKIPLFREVVKTVDREAASITYPGHIYRWKNTNKLLGNDPSCTGIKTGITWAAGPCLAASMRRDNYHVCIVILASCSPDSRWYEIPKLVNWGVKKMQKIKTS
jgi:serine-type D-Ala-D-Ala carboxypeptidase (penicillin-binding protein 5/6)